MDAVVKVACIQAEPVVLDREATIDKLERLAAEAAGAGAQLLVFPEAFVPAYPSSIWAKALAGWAEPGATEAFALFAREAVAVPGPAEARIGEAARRQRRLDRDRRHRGRSRAPLDALQHAPHPRPRRHARLQAPKARPHEPRADDLGHGRRRRPPRDPDPARTARRPDLLGELHAARALRPLRVGSRDLHRLDRRRRRCLAGDARAHRPRVSRLRRRSLPLPARRRPTRPTSRSQRLVEDAGTIGRGGSAILAPGGAYLAGPLYDEEGILYAELDPAVLWAERQRFDPAGHYHRPDVLGLRVTPNEQ